MPWISRKLYAELVARSAQAGTYEKIITKLESLLERERIRAENAVDGLLISNGHNPITPPSTVPPPDLGSSLFEEDPEELRRMESEMNPSDIGIDRAV